MKRSNGIVVVAFAALFFAALPSAFGDDGFTITNVFTRRAVFSCGDLTHSDGTIDSAGISSPGPTNKGHVASNGNIKMSGGALVDGDATAGPGKTVSNSGSSRVTGTKSSATSLVDCKPIDLAALAATLQASNDNGKIPLTGQGKNPLTGTTHTDFNLSGGDTLTLPGGTYYFTKFTMSGGSIVKITGPVRIFCTGDVSISGGSVNNAATATAYTPYRLRVWTSGVKFTLSSATMAGFIYAPSGTYTNSAAHLIGGAFANSVTVSGNSHVTRAIDDVAPGVTITAPADGAIVPDAAHVVVRGTVAESETAVTLDVNGHAVAIAADGTYQTTLDLTGVSPAAITATATDAGGNIGTAKVTVTTVPPPTLSLTSPAPGSWVNKHVVDLAGGSGTAQSVTVNGQPTTIANGVWSISGFDLGADGPHTLTIVGTNVGGSTTIQPVISSDTVVPSITGTASPAANGAGWNNVDVTVHFTCSDLGSGIATCPDDVVVSSEGQSQAVTRSATDRAGNSAPATVVVSIDKTAPAVAVAAPANNATLGDPHLVVNGAADDAVTVTVNAVAATIDPIERTYTARIDLLEGTNAIAVVGTDPAGNVGTASVSINLDTRAPEVSISAPAAEACVDASALDVRGTVADPHIGSVTVAVGTASVTAAVDANGAWSASVPVPEEGKKLITVAAADTAGHTTSVSRSVTIDRTAPVVEITEGGAPFTKAAVNRAVSLFVRAVDADPNVAVVAKLDGAAYLSGTPIGGEGSHTLDATASDCAGHSTPKSVTFVVDLTPPAIRNLNPANGGTVGTMPSSISGSTDADAVSVEISGTQLRATPAADGSFTIASVPFAEGLNRFTLLATDRAGNSSSLDYAVTVKTATASVEIRESGLPIPEGALFNRTVTPVIRSSDPSATVSATLDGTPFTSGSTISADGAHKLIGTATDTFGHAGTAEVNFTIDRTPPVVKITAPAAGTIRSDQVEVRGTAGDAVTASVNGQPVVLGADGSFVLDSLPLDVGTNAIVATGRDRAGNVGRDEVDVTRDDLGAGLLITYPPDHSLTNRPATDVVGRLLTAGRGTTVTLGTTTLSIDPIGGFRVSGYALREGENTITVTATAANGVQSSATTHVAADFTPPSLTILESGQPLVDGSRFAAQAVITLQSADTAGAVTNTLTIDGTNTTASPVTISTAGGHSIIAVARDLAGNETRAERTLFIGASSGTADCKLDSFDPANGSVVLANSTTLVGRSGGAIGVKVNGVAAAVADGAFTATVELPVEGPNAVNITCTDANGAPTGTPVAITLQRVTGDPSITITAPDENFATAQETIAVSGTLGAGVVSADVNGVAATITGSTFTVPSVRLAPGINIVVAHGRNAAGRVASASRRGVYYKDAPAISISTPSANTTTGTPKVTVSGTYTNLDPATIAIGTTTAQFVRASDTNGSFTVVDVPLTSGANTLVVSGRDRLNRAASASVVVNLVVGTPSIVITAPADHAYFGAGSANVTVNGTFQAAAGSTVDVNGVAATITGTSYTASAPFSALSGGITPIVARVTEPGGASASAAITVTQLTAAPTVLESFPAANAAEVDNGALMLVLFSQPMDVATISGAFRLEDASGTPVSGTLYLDKDVLTFAPATLLAAGGRYTLRVTTGAKNLAATPLAAEYTSAFTVAASAPSTPPALSPIGAAVCGQAITVNGTATPGARVRLQSGTLTLNTSADAIGKFSFTYPISGQSGYALVRVSTVGSDGSLSPAAELNVRIDCSGPQVLNASFDRTANKFTIQFSEPVDAATATVGTGHAILLALDDGRSIAGTASVNESLVTVTPAEDLSAKSVSLTVTTAIKDRIGNALVSPYSQTFPVSGGQPVTGDGSGFISGEVYDATTGRPLTAAAITIDTNPPVTTSTDARGRYVARLPEGAHTIKASLTGYTSVWREIIVPAGAGVVPIDIRLTRRGDPKTSDGSAIAATHGGDTSVTKKIDLTVPAGALSTGSKITLTAVGAQALTGLLPLGWSPLASAEIAVNGADAAVALSGAQLTFNVAAAEVTAAAQNLTAVAYDAQRDEWRVLVAVANVGSDGKVVVPIGGSGAYALAYPDKAVGLTTPPLPVAGDVLRGVPAAPANAPALVKRDFALNPPIILPTGRAVATLRIEGATATFPSGTAVQAYVDEELRLADGSRLLDPPFATDLLLYRTLAGDLGVADFHLGPSAKAAEVVLETGVDHVHIQPYPGRLDRGTLIGAEGGRVPADDKVAIDIPSGAVPEPLRATATSMNSTDLAAIGAVAGFRVVGGFQLTLQRVSEPAPVDLDGDGKLDPVAPVELFVPARAAFTADASKLPSPTSQVILAELLDTTPYGRMLRLAVPMAPVDPTQTSTPAIRFSTKTIDRSLLPVDGIVHEGRYVLLAAEAPIAFATGTVHALSATGRLMSDARVLAPPLGVAELSRTAGIYNIPVPAAPGAPFTLVPRHTSTGDGAAYVHPSSPAAGAVVRVDLALVPQPPVLTSVVVLKGDPPSQGTLTTGSVATDVALTTNVRAAFAPGIDPASVSADSITVTDASTGAKVSGSAAADGTVAVVWTLTAGQQLKPNGRYVIAVSGNIRGSNGALVAQGATFTVSTVKQILNTEVHRERIRITMPDANGISRITGDPGALPAGWQAVAVRRKNDFLVRYQTTAAADGSFAFFIGNGDASDKITIADVIDLRVVSNIGNLAAIFALTPFVSEDGKTFVVPAGEAVRYTTPEGITLDVPAGAFDVATVISVAAAKKEDFLDVPSLEAENEYAGSVKVDFDGVANKPLTVQMPVPTGFDTSGKQFILAEKGQSVRGPRLAVIDLMRVEGGKFTNELDPNRTLTVFNANVRASQTLVGSQFSKYLRMLLRSGIFMVLDIKVPGVGGSVGWAAMEGLQSNYDLMWDIFASYYIPHQAIAERGGALLPIITGKPFTVVGVDAGTGLQAFSRTYDPIPNGEPGTVVAIEPAQQNDGGPYPTFAAPARVELIDLDVEDVDIKSIRNFTIHLAPGGNVQVSPGVPFLDEETNIEVLNVTRGTMSSGTAASPIMLGAKVGDRLALIIEQHDVDASTPISVAFNEPVWTGGSTDPDAIDAFLHTLFKVEQAPEPIAGPPSFTDMTAQARFTSDSGGRRINVALLSALQREAVYRITLKPEIADVFKSAPGLKLGQGTVEVNGVLTPVGGAGALHLIFHTRKPAGSLNSFTAASSGFVRGMDLSGNVLFLAALEGGLLSFDMSNPAVTPPALGYLPGPPASGVTHLSVTVDRHHRVYSTAASPMAGMFRSYRVEDFLGGGNNIPIKGSALINWKIGYSQMIGLPSNTVVSDVPESLPFRIKVVLQDDETNFKNRQEFIAGASATKTGDYPDDLQKFTATIGRDGTPYAVQRITIENLSLDMSWSGDATDSGPAVIQNIVARAGDKMRLIRNQKTFAIVAHLGYGVGIYDANGIESNRQRNLSSFSPSHIREKLVLTAGKIALECPNGTPGFGIVEGYLNTDAELRGDKSGTLYSYAPDPFHGVLDLRLSIPSPDGGGTHDDDCDQRPSPNTGGLLFRSSPSGNEVARIQALRSAFSGAAGREPMSHFAQVAQYHWSIDGANNKLPGVPGSGLRGTFGGEDASRDYLLVAGFEYGLIVVDINGEPPATPAWPLRNENIADVIWIPGGAVSVRVYQSANIAVVSDRYGRAVLVDLSRIDERWDDKGAPTTGLFPTAKNALAGVANDPYGVGADDPRIIWKSDPGVVAGSVAPVFDPETGMIYASSTALSVKTLSAIDPRLRVRVNLGDEGGLSDVGGIVPLGIAPPKSIEDRIKALPSCGGTTTQCRENASLGAFRLEVALPGNMVDNLTNSNNELQLAVESERVTGAITEQTPNGFPRAHLRRTRRDGSAETGDRVASGFSFKRIVPEELKGALRNQRGYNRFLSPWIVAIADPRASSKYEWSGATAQQKKDAGCESCDRPKYLENLGESDGVFELWTNGRFVAVRPELKSATQNIFDGTRYAYLGAKSRLIGRFSTIMADTVRPTETLVAAQNAPAADGMLQQTVFLHSGEMQANSIDLDAGGRAGFNVTYDRTYRSRTIGGSVFGQGWDSSLLRRLRALPNGDVEYRDGAEVWRFRAAANGGYDSPKGLFLKLSRTQRGWKLIDQSWRVAEFDDLGRILSEADEFFDPQIPGSGNIIRYVYDETGRLTAVLDPVQRPSTIDYWSESEAAAQGAYPGLVKQLNDWRDRQVSYEYDAASGTLSKVKLPDVTNTTSKRPEVRYGYMPAAGTFNDALELRSNLITITDPQEAAMGGAARVTLTYQAGAGVQRDHAISQQWGTGETATFTYNGPTSADTQDVLGQRRSYVLTQQPKEYFSDRAHILNTIEHSVPVSNAPFGQLPATLSGAQPSTTSAERTFSFTYDGEGLLATSSLNGVRSVTYSYKNVQPEGPGFVPVSMTTTPQGGPADVVTKSLSYQSGANRSTFLAGVSANGQRIDAPEPSRAAKQVASNNSSIATTQTYDQFGLLNSSTSSGGTDTSGGGAGVSLQYAPANDSAKHRRAQPLSIDNSGLRTSIQYPSPTQTIETAPREVITTTESDTWDRPVHVTIVGAEMTVDESYEYDATGNLRKEVRKQGSTDVTTTYAYDVMGRLTSITTDNVATVGNVTRSTAYDLTGRKIVTTYPGGAVTTTTLDTLGRMVSSETTTGGSPIVDYSAYDLDGNLVLTTDLFQATARAFDAHGRAVGLMDLDGTKATATVDAWGRPTTVKHLDAGGSSVSESTFGYTPAGRLQSMTTTVDNSQSRAMNFVWDGGGRTTGISNSGRAGHSRFDAAGRLLSTDVGAGDAAAVTDSFNGTDVSGHAGSLPQKMKRKEKAGAYDAAVDYNAAADAITSNLGNLEWKSSFDQDGNATSSKSPNRPSYTYQYDSRGALKLVTMPGGATNSYAYHPTGALATYTDPANEVTSTTNDLIGRPTRRAYKDGTEEKIEWEGRRVKAITDRQGRLQTFVYNAKGQISEITGTGGAQLQKIEYDEAGRVTRLTTPDAVVEYSDFDSDGNPRKTSQSRLSGGTVIDKYTQDHTWNVHGERTSWTMPTYGGFKSTNAWTSTITLDYDAMGNLTKLQRTLGGGGAALLLDADYRNAGRPNKRTLTTAGGKSIVRDYGYDSGNGLLNRMAASADGKIVAGSEITYDGLQKAKARLLGVSGGARSDEWSYDGRSRLTASVLARDGGSTPEPDSLTTADFRTSLSRLPLTPVDPPTIEFTENPSGGHKLAVKQRGTLVEQFTFNGGERREDGRFTYDYDGQGRLSIATLKVAGSLAYPRRIRYFYDGNDWLVGRREEYAPVPIGVAPQPSDWKIEDRAEILGVEPLPADATFVWDSIDDQLVAIFKAGASLNPDIDPNGGLVRQIIHGQLRYDDPLEVATVDSTAPKGVSRLYPIYDEAGSKSLHVILNENAQIVARTAAAGPYGEDQAILLGPAVDRVSIKAKKDAAGNVVAIDIVVRSTEQIAQTSVPTGFRLAAVDSNGAAVRTSAATATLTDGASAHWSLTGAEWNALVASSGGSLALSIGATSNARGEAWSASRPFLAAPQWAVNTRPVYASAALPVEVRESLSSLSQWLASIGPGEEKTQSLYEVPTLYALALPRMDNGVAAFAPGDPQLLIVSAGFHAQPFADPLTGKNYVRARWYDPETGTWLTADPAGYKDSSNLFAYAGADPVNKDDPTGNCWNPLDEQCRKDMKKLLNSIEESEIYRTPVRAVAGVVGVGVMVAKTVGGVLEMAVDSERAKYGDVNAMMRQAQRAEAIVETVKHPVKTFIDSHERAFEQIGQEEATGHWFKASMHSSDLIAGDALTVATIAEGGVGLARAGVRAAGRVTAGAARVAETAAVEAGAGAAASVEARAQALLDGEAGQVASAYPKGRRVGGRGESVRATDPPAGVRESGAFDLTPDNIRRMEAGRPPIGRDGLPVELHHRGQNPAGPLDEMTSTSHDRIPHPVSPSQINRGAFAGERARYWRQRVRELHGQR